jgi:hypothetical protein
MENIIKTDNYLLIVSDEIPTTWYYDTYLNKLRHTGGAEYGESSISKKVIGHLPINNSPILEGVPLLPPLEDDDYVYKLQHTSLCEIDRQFGEDVMYNLDVFIKGYNKAKEKYKYTDEDLRNVIELARKFPYIKKGEIKFDTTEDEIIQSLQQPKYPIGFECEIEWIEEEKTGIELSWGRNSIKTTTNLQGQTVLVGTYIYA